MTTNCVSVEDRLKIFELCKNQLGGVWSQIMERDLIIRPVEDGFVNKLFYCFLPENIKTKYNRVVVRYVDYEELKDYLNVEHVTTISLLLSEKCISPKVLNIFNSGSIIEYIESRYFDASDDLNDKTVELLAQKLAIFHSLDMPIPKDGTFGTNDGVFEKWFDQKLRQSYREGAVREEIEKHKYPVLSKLDFINELNWLRKTIEELNSPLVLSHNDFNRRNILIKKSNDLSEVEIFLIDFDWTNYNYRGVDLGQYFACWRQKEVDFGHIDFPTDQQMSVFINAYIKEMCKIFGNHYIKQEINSRNRLIKEAKIFALFAFVKNILYCIWNSHNTENKDILIKAEQQFSCYNDLKNRCFNEYNDLH